MHDPEGCRDDTSENNNDPGQAVKSLYLVDASVYVFRAWFSIPVSVADAGGRPANAVFGFGSFLCDLIEREGAEHIVCAFDQSLTSSFRNDLYPAYKANRPLPPADLARQFEVCRSLTRSLGVPALVSERYEADDLIGSCAAHARQHGYRMVYVTADKDYAQLLEVDDLWWDVARGQRLDVEAARHRIGVWPDQVVDFLALAGDAVDNIPGVPGIGNKTAAALLDSMDSLDGVYRDLDRVARLGIRGAARIERLLREHREQALLSRELSRIRRDLPLTVAAGDFAWSGTDPRAIDALDLPLQLRSRCNRLPLASAVSGARAEEAADGVLG